MRSVVSNDHTSLAQKLKEVLAVYKEAEDLINIGAYKAGSNPRIDKAIKLHEGINSFLRQSVEDPTDYNQCLRALQMLLVNA